MVDRTDGLLYQTGQGYSQLDAQSARDRLDGYAVVSGLDVTPGGSLSVDVAAGEAIVGTDTNGDTITVSPGSTQTVSLAAADSANPRKDTVWIDDTGTAQVATGTAESALPEGNSRFNTFQPEPPFPGGDGTILAEVYVAAGVSSLTSADIRDRRQPAQIVGADAQVASVTGASGTGVYDDDTQTVGDGTTSADHESVSTDQGPSEKIRINATDSDAQSSVENASQGATIEIYGGEYDPGSRTDIPQDVKLSFVGQGVFAPTADYDGFLIGRGSRGTIIADTSNITYSSSVAVADPTDAGGSYRLVDNTEFAFDVIHEGGGGETFRTNHYDGSNATIGCFVRVWSDSADAGIVADMKESGNAFANGIEAELYAQNVGKAMRHIGVSRPAKIEVSGVIQPGTPSTHLVENITGNAQSFRFTGQVFDLVAFDTATIDGNGVYVFDKGTQSVDNWLGTFAGNVSRSRVFGWENAGDGQYWVDCDYDEGYEIRYDVGLLRYIHVANDGTRTNITDYRRGQSFQVLNELTIPSESNGASGHAAGSSLAWDETDSRLELKDGGGTVHYFTPEGTE